MSSTIMVKEYWRMRPFSETAVMSLGLKPEVIRAVKKELSSSTATIMMVCQTGANKFFPGLSGVVGRDATGWPVLGSNATGVDWDSFVIECGALSRPSSSYNERFAFALREILWKT